jgi:VacB/RNase II family 3'-5' exoribonuclease
METPVLSCAQDRRVCPVHDRLHSCSIEKEYIASAGDTSPTIVIKHDPLNYCIPSENRGKTDVVFLELLRNHDETISYPYSVDISMTALDDKGHRVIIQRIARRAMMEHGLLPDFSSQAQRELENIRQAAVSNDGSIRDLRHLLWCSIDNDDSRDLDQLTVAEALTEGSTKILVAIADVGSVVTKPSALDDHAQHNTTSVYTAAQIFPMLPEKLSTDLTSLNFAEDRLSVVLEAVVARDGSLRSSDVYRATVRNQARLSYNSVAAWLVGTGPMPDSIGAVRGLDENLRLQYRVAQSLKSLRHLHGALDLETIEARPIFEGDDIHDFSAEKRNEAKDIIQDFMIAANGITAHYLEMQNVPSLRRVVRAPKRWDRIIELASDHGFKLPEQPDSKALDQFLLSAKAADPTSFPDLSLSVIKLLGAGEYVVELPGGNSVGHFGLAVKDYTHSTAPNRRYTDVITQRLLTAALAGSPSPYTVEELDALAKYCTEAEDAVKKVERQVTKSAAALLLESRIGEQFDAIVTGASPKGTWVRLLHPPIEGRLVRGHEGFDVGHKIRVRLLETDVERGYIDFEKTSST